MTTASNHRCGDCDHVRYSKAGDCFYCTRWAHAHVTIPDGFCDQFSGDAVPTRYLFNFQPHKRAGDVYDQLKHAAGEIVEATQAMGDSSLTCAIEVIDAIECLEGALRAMEDESDGIVDVAYWLHYRKNAQRGDYGEGD